MDLDILDYSIYDNRCDRDSDRLLVRALQKQGLAVRVVALTPDRPVSLVAPRVWLRYDLRSLDELRWIVDLAEKLERSPTCVFPTARSLSNSEDKWETCRALRQAGVPTVPALPLSRIRDCGSRAVIKPRVGWGGMAMCFVGDTHEIEGKKDDWDENFICQPYIAHEQTWTVAVAADGILFCLEKSPGKGDYRTNELQGGKTRLVSPPEGAGALARAGLEAVGLTAGTVDLLPVTGGLEVLEVNSAPGLAYPGHPHLDLAGPMVKAVLEGMEQS